MVLSAVETTSRSSTTMNDATDASARAQRWAPLTASCLLVVFTCPPSVCVCDACCWTDTAASRELTGEFAGRLVSVREGPGPGSGRCEDVIVTTTALARARAGDGEAFGELTDPYRPELQLHCYR